MKTQTAILAVLSPMLFALTTVGQQESSTVPQRAILQVFTLQENVGSGKSDGVESWVDPSGDVGTVDVTAGGETCHGSWDDAGAVAVNCGPIANAAATITSYALCAQADNRRYCHEQTSSIGVPNWVVRAIKKYKPLRYQLQGNDFTVFDGKKWLDFTVTNTYELDDLSFALASGAPEDEIKRDAELEVQRDREKSWKVPPASQKIYNGKPFCEGSVMDDCYWRSNGAYQPKRTATKDGVGANPFQ